MGFRNERFFIHLHIAASALTLLFCLLIATTCLVPSLIPPLYRMIADERISLVVPYLLLITLGQSLFSLWYFSGQRKR
jgi:hypothetical protein